MLERSNFFDESRKHSSQIFVYEANDALVSNEIRLLGLSVLVKGACVFEDTELTGQISPGDPIHNGVLH